jgi:hypothetical protein
MWLHGATTPTVLRTLRIAETAMNLDATIFKRKRASGFSIRPILTLEKARRFAMNIQEHPSVLNLVSMAELLSRAVSIRAEQARKPVAVGKNRRAQQL